MIDKGQYGAVQRLFPGGIDDGPPQNLHEPYNITYKLNIAKYNFTKLQVYNFYAHPIWALVKSSALYRE
jgi:hypothetical protein